ncbi:MAG: HD domain-containing protein [Planctomycetes bacterium]|nr:HD domain-containing protein [Planctomycetota bacterium]
MSELPRVDETGTDAATRRREAVAAFAHDLVVAIVDAEIHAPNDHALEAHLVATARALREALSATAGATLVLACHGGRILWDGVDLVSASLQGSRLLRIAAERGIASFTFDVQVDGRVLGRLIELLRDPRAKEAFRPQAIDMVLRARGIRGVGLAFGQTGAIAAPAITPQTALRAPAVPALGQAMAGYQAMTAALQDSHVRATRGREIELDATRGVVERAVATMSTAPSDLLALAVYDDIDRFTVGHSVRVALLALQVARAAHASEEQLLLVGTAGMLHDIGKSHVPQEVLFKQGRLDDDEWRVMAEHPRLGAELLLEQKDVHKAAIGAAYCHHMAPNGLGYPRPAIPFDPSGISKLVRVCDVFEALTAVRPYKRDLTPLEALAVMHREAKGFDPHWFRFFVQTIGVYPIGTRVRLSNGDRALVVRQGIAIDRPVVRLIGSQSVDDLPAADARELTIGDRVDDLVLTIDAVVRRRSGAQAVDASDRIAAVMQHACLGKPTPRGS